MAKKRFYFPAEGMHFITVDEDDLAEKGYIAAKRIVPVWFGLEVFLAKRCADGMIAPQGYWEYFDWTAAWAGQFSVPTAVLQGESALFNIFFV